MDDICRLCCSKNFVNNSIFDEENALYLKMSLYLPIKVFKNDRLPQKVCDKCSCKVNDFYQFCNETIEVQNRLRSYYISSEISTGNVVDLTRIKANSSPLPGDAVQEQSTQTEWPTSESFNNSFSNSNNQHVKIKEEPRTLSPIKEENIYDDFGDTFSDNSDNISLITLKKNKRSKKSENGVKKTRKKKSKLNDLQMLMSSLPEGTNLSVIDQPLKQDPARMLAPIKIKNFDVSLDVKHVKKELGELEIFNCCICMMQCFSKNEMIRHYRSHASEAALPAEPPAPPAPPDVQPLRCLRCRKALSVGEWAAHWRRHWERDRRPYRCTLCEKTFRDPHQILKHGLTHKYSAEGGEGGEDAGEGGGGGAGGAEAVNKRFICDLCPESFVYMRYLQAHRTRAHPEAAARALLLRCGSCGRQFAHLNSLRRHLRAHDGTRDHLCNVCGKALSSREHLKFHIRIHTGYKPNVCKTCGKGFVKKCNLTLHERVHSGEKPHVCAACGKAFSQRSTLVIHERYHSGARPYACPHCARGFVAKGLLSMHLKTTCI